MRVSPDIGVGFADCVLTAAFSRCSARALVRPVSKHAQLSEGQHVRGRRLR